MTGFQIRVIGNGVCIVMDDASETVMLQESGLVKRGTKHQANELVRLYMLRLGPVYDSCDILAGITEYT